MRQEQFYSVFLRTLKPMRARTVAMLATLSVAIPRLLPGIGVTTVIYPLRYLPQEFFGWMALISSLALFVTRKKLRLRVAGRVAAVLAFTVWCTLFAATTSWTSRLLDLVFIAILFVEILTPYDDC